MVHVTRRILPLGTALLLWAGPALAQNGAITGRVTDAQSGNALAGAQVQAIDVGGTVAGQTVSGTSGEFRIANLAPGTYAVSVSIIGYETRRMDVRVVAGETSIAALQLHMQAFTLNPIVVSATKTTEKALDAPASVSVIGQREIETTPVVTPADYLRSTPGIDIITQGVQSTNVAARGFNNIFSGSLHMLTDYRIAGVPSLRVNVMHFVPATSDDLERIEVVLGPASALYGPNTADGVLQMITKSPLTSQGTIVGLAGGNQSVFKGTFRTAQKLSDRVGVKVSGLYFNADEWPFTDTVEVSEAARFKEPIFRHNLILALGDSLEAMRRIALIGTRDFKVDRWSGEARLDWQATENVSTIFQAGMTNVGSAIEMTGLGAGQVEDWRYTYYQARLNWERLFAQVYLNTSNAGDTYLLRTGQPIVDNSRLWVAQLQHGISLAGGRQDFTYGVDYLFTDPRTNGTINGTYENHDQTTEIGGYLQSETQLTSKLNLTLAGRLDHHSALPDVVFSPRAGIVFKPTEDQAFRLTYNRAYSTPTSLNQFLDLSTAIPQASAAALGYSVRVQGTGETGFHFRQADGSYLMRSPFTPTQLGGPSQLLPAAGAAAYWQAAVGVMAAAAAQKGSPIDPSMLQYLLSLAPTPTEISANVLDVTAGTSEPASTYDIPDVEPIRESTSTAVEAGYRGIIAGKLLLAADLWWERRNNFVTPLTVYTPFIALNGTETGVFLVQHFIQDLGMSPQQAQATAAALAPGLAAVPVGVVSSPEVDANGAQLLATYTNVHDHIDLWGSDLSATALLSDAWSLSATASLADKDYFDASSIGVGQIITLNAPRRKGSVALTYRPLAGGLNGEARVRFNSQFPVQSGVYNATECVPGARGLGPGTPCVKNYTLADLTLGYRLPGLQATSLELSVQNLFDTKYQSFPGTAVIGRMALLQAKYSF